MRQRKIDDERLLEMLKEGKQQKEIAAHFNVSPVAICKRLKRLLPQPETILDKFDLTEKEKLFALEKAKGKNNTQAALSSYEVSSMQSAKVIGSQLMANPEIQYAINDLMETYGIGRVARVRKLKQFVDHPDPTIGIRALDMSLKLADEYPSNKVNITANANSFTQIQINLLDIPQFEGNKQNDAARETTI